MLNQQSASHRLDVHHTPARYFTSKGIVEPHVEMDGAHGSGIDAS